MFRPYTIPPGKYSAKIRSVTEDDTDPFHSKITLTLALDSPPFNYEIETRYKEYWTPGSRFVNLLQDLEIYPDEGKSLELRKFRDLPVRVTIEHKESNGLLYTNVTKISLRKAKMLK